MGSHLAEIRIGKFLAGVTSLNTGAVHEDTNVVAIR